MKLRPFELALVIIFGGLLLLAIVLLRWVDPNEEQNEAVAAIGAVTIWGTLPQQVVASVLSLEAETNEAYENVNYWYVKPDEFEDRLVNALADGVGPDLVLVSHEKLVELRSRIQPISYQSFPMRDIKSTYVDGVQIFALNDGLYAMPISVDPLMMYWNRDILVNKGILSPPKTWEELVNSTLPQVIERDFNRNIERSVVALGEYNNIRNAFGMISALLIQSGSQLIQVDNAGGYKVRLQSSVNQSGDPLRSTVDFYTRFSEPSNTLYSWNRSFNDDRSEFIAEDLVFYFGHGSEGVEIERLNPNLNFDIAEIPQGATDTVRRTYGKFYGLSLLRASNNKGGASNVMFNLGSGRLSNMIAQNSRTVPVIRGLVAAGSNDIYGRANYQSASVALGWLNPDRGITDQIFFEMTRDVNENRRDVSGAATDAATRIGRAF